MVTDNPIIVSTGVTPNTTQIHHREFPEIRGEGTTPADAASHLGNQLVRALDTALTPWRRETMQKAIDEVQAFAEGQG